MNTDKKTRDFLSTGLGVVAAAVLANLLWGSASPCMAMTLFRKRFREYNGMSPLEYQIALRIRRAMHLLESTDLPIAQIAEETGFESHAYFSRLFHARVGTPPIQFRLAHAT